MITFKEYIKNGYIKENSEVFEKISNLSSTKANELLDELLKNLKECDNIDEDTFDKVQSYILKLILGKDFFDNNKPLSLKTAIRPAFGIIALAILYVFLAKGNMETTKKAEEATINKCVEIINLTQKQPEQLDLDFINTLKQKHEKGQYHLTKKDLDKIKKVIKVYRKSISNKTYSDKEKENLNNLLNDVERKMMVFKIEEFRPPSQHF